MIEGIRQCTLASEVEKTGLVGAYMAIMEANDM